MLSKGLTTGQVNSSRAAFGSNQIRASRGAVQTILLEVLKEPMVLLLAIACFFYFFMQLYQEGFIMAVAIILVAGISVYQQVRSENAVKALNKLTQELTTVIRDGVVTSVPSEELVCGDIIQITEGQHVSADAEIIELNDLSVDESILTGESFAVPKSAPGQPLYSGTTVTSGMAWAKITAVGVNTGIGKLGKSMEKISREKTPLQIQTGNFVKRMALFGIIAFLFVWGYNYLDSGDILDGLLHGLTIAMSVLPEEIPVALSTFMALGAYRMIKQHVLTKQPQTVEALGAATVICVDKTGTITENKMKVAELFILKSNRIISDPEKSLEKESLELLQIAMLASESDPFDPMEKAIHDCYNSVCPVKGEFKMIKEYPLSGTNPKMTHVYQDESGKRIISCKGAPEGIILQSDLDEGQKQLILTQLKEMAAKGNRVLAVGTGIYDKENLPDSQDDYKFEFLGLISLNDPPKKNISEVIRNFYDSGIDVKMITGDYPETAMSIASRIQLRNNNFCVTGAEIAGMNEAQLQQTLKSTSVFARVLPETKLLIIEALKASGEVVAMTGDGVNDGPALKAAHIGIAMGKRGSEVARKAASLVLTNDDLSSMVTAVAYGRNIYTNLKKAIQYIISIHIPLISIVTLPLLLGWKFPNIFSPVHVIFLELIMGPTCSIVYENEPMEKDLMKQAPRKMSDSLFTWSELSRSVIQGLAITFGLMGLYYFLMVSGAEEMTIRTMVFSTLVFSNMLLTLTGRSADFTIATTISYKNKLVPIALVITLFILLMSIYFHPMMAVFEFEHIGVKKLLICSGVAMLSVLWIELYKMTGKAK